MTSVIKVLLIGATGSGKTALCQRFTDANFIAAEHVPTKGLTIKDKLIDENSIKLNIYDLSGNPEPRTIATVHYSNAHIAIFTIDLSVKLSELQKQIDRLKQEIADLRLENKNSTIMIVGTKKDLSGAEANKLNKSQLLGNFAQENNLVAPFFISTQTGEGVNELFNKVAELAKQITDRKKQEYDERMSKPLIMKHQTAIPSILPSFADIDGAIAKIDAKINNAKLANKQLPAVQDNVTPATIPLANNKAKGIEKIKAWAKKKAQKRNEKKKQDDKRFGVAQSIITVHDANNTQEVTAANTSYQVHLLAFKTSLEDFRKELTNIYLQRLPNEFHQQAINSGFKMLPIIEVSFGDIRFACESALEMTERILSDSADQATKIAALQTFVAEVKASFAFSFNCQLILKLAGAIFIAGLCVIAGAALGAFILPGIGMVSGGAILGGVGLLAATTGFFSRGYLNYRAVINAAIQVDQQVQPLCSLHA